MSASRVGSPYSLRYNVCLEGMLREDSRLMPVERVADPCQSYLLCIVFLMPGGWEVYSQGSVCPVIISLCRKHG